jgi:very-short-patch-repair endonuclease
MKKGFKHSKETKEKLRLINLGKHHSEITKEKCRLSSTGRKFSKHTLSEETKQKLRVISSGRKHTEESKQKMRKPKSEQAKQNMSLARKGQPNGLLGKKRPPFSEEWRRKIGLAVKGRKVSDETRKKLRLIHLGKKFSDATKQKIRIANINYRVKMGKFNNFIGKNETELLDRQEQIDGCKIIRQHYIKHLGYIVDGYCEETNTIYEVYEKYHLRQVEHDIKRQQLIQEYMNCLFIIIWDNVQVVPMESKEN